MPRTLFPRVRRPWLVTGTWKHYTQPNDHFGSTPGTFAQRVCLYSRYYDTKPSDSPPLVFFYVVEVFLNDGRGNGSAVSTFGASYGPNATAVLLRAVGADAPAAGSLWEMANAITPPP